MKVALIGIGHWGQILLHEIKKQTEVKYECDSKTDLVPIFADPEIQAVFIATPTETHFEIAQKALDANKHVFLEKPGTTSSGDLEILVQQTKQKKLIFSIGYEFPHHPIAKKLETLLKGQKINGVFFEWRKWGTFKDDAVMHLLCHEISIAKALGMELEPVSCSKIKVISDSDILETKFKNNIKSVINRVSPIKDKTITVLRGESSYIWSGDDLFEINNETRALDKINVPEITSVAAEISDFLLSITNSREPLTSGRFALDVYRIIEEVSRLH